MSVPRDPDSAGNSGRLIVAQTFPFDLSRVLKSFRPPCDTRGLCEGGKLCKYGVIFMSSADQMLSSCGVVGTNTADISAKASTLSLTFLETHDFSVKWEKIQERSVNHCKIFNRD